MILKMTLNFLYALAQRTKQLFYANLLNILSPPAHIQYHKQNFFFLRRSLQSSKNTLDTIFVCTNVFDHHGTASSNNRPSFSHSRNLGSVPPLLVYPGEIVNLAHH